MRLLLLSIAIWLQLNGTAFAYIDPGTGSILIQAVVAVIATVFGIVSLWWKKFKSLFTRAKPPEEPK